MALGGRTHFCLTTWWGTRLLLDLPAGRVVGDSAEFEPELVKAEKTFAYQTLEDTRLWKYNPQQRGLATNSPGPNVAEVTAAMLLAARLELLETVPFLRTLESSPIIHTIGGGHYSYKPPSGGIEPGVCETFRVRQFAHLCLRRLGVRPSTHQSTRLYRKGDGYWHPPDPLPFQREQRVSDLKEGMAPEEVLALIGAPDFIISGVWEYDLDGDEPTTLVIRWGQDGCEKIAKQTPPKWRDGDTRDCELAH